MEVDNTSWKKKLTPQQKAEYKAEKREEMQNLFKKIDDGVKAVFESDSYKKCLQYMSKFTNYSAGNCILIIAQKETEHELKPYMPAPIVLQNLDTITADFETETTPSSSEEKQSETTESTKELTASDVLPESTRQSLIESAQSMNEAYPDAIGWLYIPNTNMTYPVTQGRDNEYYLSHAYDGSSLKAGTIFLDCRCENRFMNPVNILYGHSMKNGTMFAGVLNFADSSYFNSHRCGWLATPKLYTA